MLRPGLLFRRIALYSLLHRGQVTISIVVPGRTNDQPMKKAILSAILLCAAGISSVRAQYLLEVVPATDKYTLQGDGNMLYSRGSDAIYYSSDSGYTWNTWCTNISQQLGANRSLSSAFVLDAATAVITARATASDTTFIFKTIDSGQSWQLKHTGVISQLAYSTRTISGVYFSDAMNGWAHGKGLILHTSDGGETWQQQFAHYESPYNSDYLVDMFATDAQHAWAAGYGAAIVNTVDGTTWSYQYANDTGTYGNTADDPCYYIYNIHFNSPQRGYASSAHGFYLKTTNAGQSWTPETTGFPNDNKATFSVNDSLVWMVGGDWCDNNGCYEGQSVLYSLDGGQSWLSLHDTTGAVGVNTDFRDVFFFDENLGYTTRNDGKIYRIRNVGVGIEEFSPSLVSVSPNPTTDVVNLHLPDRFNAVSVRVLTIHGQTAHEQRGTNLSQIDLSGLVPGVYLLLISDNTGATVQARVVKK